MKHIRSVLAAALVTFGGAAVASAQQATPVTPAPAPHARHAHGAKGARGQFAARNLRHQLFKGIKLSDAEKANVKSVHAKYAPQMKALREQLKPQLEAARAARQRGDTAALKSMWEKSATEREQTRKLLEAERNDLRAALTPENQAKFDANVTRLEQRVAQRAQKTGRNLRRPGQGSRP